MKPPGQTVAFALLSILTLALACGAQAQDRVLWTLTPEGPAAPGGLALLDADARIQPGWHLYSASSPSGLPASFQVDPGSISRVLQPPPKKALDPTSHAQAETYENEVKFLLEIKIPADAGAGSLPLTVRARFQTCNDTECIPGRWTGTAAVNIDASAKAAPVIPAGYAEAKRPAPAAAETGSADVSSQGWAAFLLVAFGFGLASIFTPCVFPMIPITMSYFLNRRSGERRDSVTQAVVFCLGIVVLFSGLGLLVTAILGPFGVSRLGGSPWVNGFIAALFIAFGLSLLGAFEIVIPSSILTRLNESSGRGGFAGALLMGLTFSLASFACVGPFVGTLLAASAGSGGARPLAGMVTFAAGLALPFFLLALFPAYLKRLPKSGSWMARVKVVMGFVILAASLKYLSSLDQAAQWGLLTRERFLAIWIVLFAMAGLYLLGFLRLEGVKEDEPLGLGRLLTGMAFLVFALSLTPGMFGGKLGELDAYVPEAASGSSSLGGSAGPALAWMKDDYRGALDRARAEGKLVFVNFTGYACANCHWMEANMFPRAEIAAALGQYVLVDLYTDGTDAASDANGKLELDKFQTSAEPFYAIMDADEKVIATSAGATRDPQAFLAFLNKGSQPGGAAAKAANPPQAAAPAAKGSLSDIPTKTLGGDKLSLGGKVVVINFWATWCVPCVAEAPGFNRAFHEFQQQGVTIVGVAMDDEGKSVVAPFLKKHPIDYPVVIGDEALGDKFALDGYPVTVIYDRSGKEANRLIGFTGPNDLDDAIRKAL
ncbi:MAG TPA: cytochrome c biogenesis protein CcdA [Bryobacteraceae bacterium]|nr:cytochrome c biogenesis protein CcdA [Bryobacteraceae bacterium]